MEQRAVFRGAALAAIVAFAAAVFMGFVFTPPEAGITLQPSLTFGPVSDFVYSINKYPQITLRFFAADSLFVLSYLMVFSGLYAASKKRSPVFAGMGLAAGAVAALFDAAENAFFISYAAQAANGVPLTDPALPLIYVASNLKWMGAFAALFAFGLVWPRENWLQRVISGLMLLFPLVGVLGVASPSLVPLRGLFFLIGMPLFAWFFWRQSRV